MIKRIISALIGIPILLGLTWLGGWYFAALMVAIAVLSLNEFLRIGREMGIKPLNIVIVLLTAGWFILLFTKPYYMIPYFILEFLIVFSTYTISYPKYSWKDGAWSLLALIYPVGLLTCLYGIRVILPLGQIWAFYTFLTVWATDTGAYFIGSLFGRHRLAPQMSPNKSSEGAIGGVAASLAVGACFWYFLTPGPIWAILTVSFIASVFAQLGDLFESSLKRTAGVKDSGSLIPGHGGFLDRFDSFLFAAPIIFICLFYWMIEL